MSPHRGRPNASELAERGIDTRQNILDVFAKLVAEQGYSATSIAAVAAEVGVSKGTIVHHFPSKELMLQEGHLQYITRRLDEMTRILARVDDPALLLTAMVYCIVRAHRDDRAGTIAFLREFAHFASTPLSTELQAQRAEYTAIMTGIVRRASAQGVFRIEDPRITSLQVFGMVNYLWTWYRPERAETAERIAAQFASNILNGLLVMTDSVRSDDTIRAVASHGGTDGAPAHRVREDRYSTASLLEFIDSIRPLLAPAQANAPTRLVDGRRLD